MHKNTLELNVLVCFCAHVKHNIILLKFTVNMQKVISRKYGGGLVFIILSCFIFSSTNFVWLKNC